MTNIKNLDLNLLKVFDTLMDEKNVSRAAEKLSVTQPAVSGMLTRLRGSFHDPLFIRSQHGIVPTERAIELAGPIKQILHQLSEVLEPISFIPETATTTFTIAATDYSLKAILLPLLQQLHPIAPNIKVSVRWINDEQILSQLEKGEVDVALMTPDTAPNDLRVRTLFDEHYVCVVRQEHPQARHGQLSLDEFCELKHGIVSYIGGAFSGATDSVLRQLNRSRTVVVSVPSFLALVDILKHSDLCAVVPSRLLQGIDGLTVMNLPFDVPGFTKVMLWHERTHLSASHQWLRDMVYQICHTSKPEL